MCGVCVGGRRSVYGGGMGEGGVCMVGGECVECMWGVWGGRGECVRTCPLIP